MSDTPRTDFVAAVGFGESHIESLGRMQSHAQILERELAETTVKESLTTAKPVAWMSTKMAGVVIAHQPEDFQRHPDRWQPLYAAQMLRPETEYICKCGLRVTPHRCKTDMEF